MSAELLRRAAAKMRETATRAHFEAPDLTWAANKVYDGVYSLDLGPATHPDADSHGAGEDCRMPREIARHVASWPPAVALAVANMLDAIAEAWPVSDPVYAKTSRAEALGHRQALVLARAYLGESA